MLKDFTKEAFDFVIQAGQSNAEGYGFGPVDDPWQPDERVWTLNENFTISQAAEKVTGNEIQSNFSFAFAREYLRAGRLSEGRKLLILRAAVGGTGFRDGHWKPEDDLYLRMLDMIRTVQMLNPENRPIALLWHQGETDAGLEATYEEHYHNLMTLVKGTRAAVRREDLPFVAGDFVAHWKNDNLAICTPVVDAIRAVCRDCDFGAFVETDDLLSNRQELQRNPLGWEDPIHFSRRSVYELGRRYYAAFAGIPAGNSR